MNDCFKCEYKIYIKTQAYLTCNHPKVIKDKEIRRIIHDRNQFELKYCQSKKWNWRNLNYKQEEEIRNQPEWKKLNSAVSEDFDGSDKISSAAFELNIVAKMHGVINGWFNWPDNFVPEFLVNCDGFKEKELKDNDLDKRKA